MIASQDSSGGYSRRVRKYSNRKYDLQYMSKIRPKECQNVEFKRIWKDEYLKWICGFANAQGAVMYFGVDDDHEVVGLKDSKRLLEDIPSKVVNYMGLVVDVNLYERDGLDYIELVVEPSNVAISYKGKYYYRSGSTMQELNGVALQQFLLKKMGRSWDDITNERATLEDIDRNAIDYFLKKGIEAQRIPESERDASIKDVLESLGLLDDNGNLKNAAVLLFGKNPQKFFPSAVFKIGRFGKDEADLMFQDVIEGNIIQMADRVMEALQAKYLVSPVRFEGMQRYETLEIPKEALREILYNALAHKDYTGPDIQMHVYNDHIEVWNEGELPGGYDETVLYGKHSSKPRNRNIAGTMFKAGFIDTWGRGFKKIREGFEKVGMPMPKVENFCGGVQVTIERTKFMQMTNVGGDVTKDVTKDIAKQLSDRQRIILRLIKDDTFVTTNEMSQKTGVTTRTIKRDLEYLQEHGVLIREGGRKEGRWLILIE